MRHRIAWISVWVTLVFWLGHAGGCASANKPGDAPATPATPAPTAAAKAPTPAAGPVHSTGPSLRGIDRSHWPRVTVAHESGVVTHRPHYFNDLQVANRGMALPSRGDEAADQLDAAVSGGWSEGWSGPNTVAMCVEPLNFAVDLVALPVKMVLHRPWQDRSSPPACPCEQESLMQKAHDGLHEKWSE